MSGPLRVLCVVAFALAWTVSAAWALSRMRAQAPAYRRSNLEEAAWAAFCGLCISVAASLLIGSVVVASLWLADGFAGG